MEQQDVNPNLADRDYTLIIDRSGSMGDPVSKTNRKSRWDYMQEETKAIARDIHALDSDGITLYTFAGDFKRYDNVQPDKVDEVFSSNSPGGSTDLAAVLDNFFASYFARRAKGQTKANGEFAVIVTDGAPSDGVAAAKVIADNTQKLNGPKEVSLLIVQVGQDSGAKEYLDFLDDNLVKGTREFRGAKYDIVSVITDDKLGNRKISDVIAQAISEAKV